MGKTYAGAMNGARKRFMIIVSRFNEYITKHLLESAVDTLVRHGVPKDRIDVTWVPGAMEIPVTLKRVITRKRWDAVITLGCVIRGDTPHFEYVAGECAKGIAEVARDTGIPVAFGVITADTLEQAIERAGSKMGNKGGEAAMVALEMADLMKKL